MEEPFMIKIVVGLIATVIGLIGIIISQFKKQGENKNEIKELKQENEKKTEDLNILKDYAKEAVVIQKERNETDKKIIKASEEDAMAIANDIIKSNNDKLRNNRSKSSTKDNSSTKTRKRRTSGSGNSK